MTVGVVLVGFGFAGFVSFTDIMWKSKLRDLFVVATNGTCLYGFSFEKQETIPVSEILAGGLLGIQNMLSEMVKTKGTLNNIEYQSVSLVMEQAVAFSAILVLKEPSTYLQFKLKEFIGQFSSFFEVALADPAPDPALFTPTKGLVERLFQ
jgi:hypothetical protein